ncbi:hypothetical protein RHMOL_Rhmol11G0024100 [Rhododendron molle]|uniref:Uncharacterized protein n=1 Tax=Rhododendron molle TaxID=49168 RepID=A0ACC0LP55_RHOML|nr:hypothetical protein RHMOL_Rhmol11G0024100 [Rhododendron molle]
MSVLPFAGGVDGTIAVGYGARGTGIVNLPKGMITVKRSFTVNWIEVVISVSVGDISRSASASGVPPGPKGKAQVGLCGEYAMALDGVLEEVGETNSAGAAAQTLWALQDGQRQFLEMQKQLLAAFTGLTELILAVLPKATVGQNDEPVQNYAGGNTSQTAQLQIPLSTPHHLRPVLIGGIAGNPIGERQKEMPGEGYSPPKFVKFDGKEGSAQEHKVRFVESLRAHASDSNLCLCEFSKSLTSRAYTWYVNLEPYSITTWEEMVNSFYAKFFEVRDKVTVISLMTETQNSGEDVVDYIRRFQDRAVDYTESVKEIQLVEICIGGMMDEFKMLLINLKLGTFSALLESAYNIRHVVKPARKESWKCKPTGATIAVAEASRAQQPAGERKQREREPGPAPYYPCIMDEVRDLVTAWIADGELELPPVEYEPTREVREHPRIGRRDIRVDPYPIHDHNNGEDNMAECYPFMYEDEDPADSHYHLEDNEEDEWAYMVPCHEIIDLEKDLSLWLLLIRTTRPELPHYLGTKLDAQVRCCTIKLSSMPERNMGRKESHYLRVRKLFDSHEPHLSDEVYFFVQGEASQAVIAKPRGIKIPRWEDIKNEKQETRERDPSAAKVTAPRKITKTKEGGTMVFHL